LYQRCSTILVFTTIKWETEVKEENKGEFLGLGLLFLDSRFRFLDGTANFMNICNLSLRTLPKGLALKCVKSICCLAWFGDQIICSSTLPLLIVKFIWRLPAYSFQELCICRVYVIIFGDQ
jgi:hypothetical protein